MAAPAIAAPRGVAAGKPHVVMLVFDEFPRTRCSDRAAHRLPAVPEPARLAGDSTGIRTPPRSRTGPLRGAGDPRPPLAAQERDEFVRDHRRTSSGSSPAGLPAALHRGDHVALHTDGCQQLLGRGFDALVAAGRFERLRQTFRSIQRGRPTFTFHHSLLPHHPWVYLPSGRLSLADDPGWANWLTGPGGFSHQFLTRHSEQRHLLQLGAVDRAIGELIARLRKTRLYRKAWWSSRPTTASPSSRPHHRRRPESCSTARARPADHQAPGSAAERSTAPTSGRWTSCRPWPGSWGSASPGGWTAAASRRTVRARRR